MIHITKLQDRVGSPEQNLCLSSSPGVKSPPEVTEDSKMCLLGFTEQWNSAVLCCLSAKQILLNAFSFVPLLLKEGAAPNAELRHNLIYSLLSLPAGALSHLVCAFN